jgi:hypothetical protein
MNSDQPISTLGRKALFGLLLSISACAIGCGSGNARVYPVRGEVFVHGKPAEGAAVHLHPRDKEKCRPAFATVEADGTFQMTTFAKNDGALPGEYVVTVVWRDERTEDGETIYSADKLGARYSKANTSTLNVTVTIGDNDLPLFDLK